MVYGASSLCNLYSMASTNASQLASMMFSLTPMVPHRSCWSATFNDHTDAGRRSGFRVDNADLVVDQTHLSQGWKGPIQGFAQRGVQGIDRTVSFADLVPELVAVRGA